MDVKTSRHKRLKTIRFLEQLETRHLLAGDLVAVSDAYFVKTNETIAISQAEGVLANELERNDSEITAQLVETTQHGVLTLNENGSFQYVPQTDYQGMDRFLYRVRDGQSTSENAIVQLDVSNAPVLINEFMATNAGSLTTRVRESSEDQFNRHPAETPDWIELKNPRDVEMNIGGLFLTDDPDNRTKWKIPADTTIPADGYLIAFASNENIVDIQRDENGFLHTNFTLNPDGEYLALTGKGGVVFQEFANVYPEQRPEISFGIGASDSNSLLYFSEPTPGSANSTGKPAIVVDTKFSVQRGLFDQPFIVEISTTTENATIRYTTDGTNPTENNGTVYADPISISNTTTLRAAAFRDDLIPTNIDTQSYFFLSDVVKQDHQAALDAGFPETWSGVSPDYGLDSESQLPLIAGNTNLSVDDAQGVIVESLRSIPTLSLVMNLDDLFGRRGIYSNPEQHGPAWERPTSVELVHPDGSEGFQIDAGIRIQGGAFRSLNATRKKSLRLMFKAQYGDAKLQYPFFGPDATDEFDTITLRMEANDGYQWNEPSETAQYMRDQYMRETTIAMGNPDAHGNYVHVYINGQYWGLYNAVERPDKNFAASYFGVNDDDWDGINAGAPPSAENVINAHNDIARQERTLQPWNELLALAKTVRRGDTEEIKHAAYMQILGLNPDGTNHPEYETLIDVENYIDYMIANMYGNNVDWPHKNYYTGRENSPDSEGFKFFSWDAEWTLFLRNNERDVNLVRTAGGVADPYGSLRTNPEFQVLFGDHVQKHFFNGGALYVDPENPDWDPQHPERNVPAARYAALAGRMRDALIAESARWGDQHRSVPFTRDVEWQAKYDQIMSHWFPVRGQNLLNEFRKRDMFPNLDTPIFSQRGGLITSDLTVTLSAPDATIYYTLDGSDPRVLGGEISPTAIEYTEPIRLTEATRIRTRAISGEEWSAIDEASFVVDAVPADATSLRISEIHYHPAAATAMETDAGFSDADEFEFIELVNISEMRIDLTEIQLTEVFVDGNDEGVDFDFASGHIVTLDPGETIVVVENINAFKFRYGDNVPVAGQWSGRLSNGGERITLLADDIVIHEFAYDDIWYPETDGQGASLEFIDPNHDDLKRWGQQEGWRPSTQIGGSPGVLPDAPIPGDSNHDGIFNSRDLVLVFITGEYEDQIAGNSTFEDGDWNGDNDFTSSDFVFVFEANTYVQDSIPATLKPQNASAIVADESIGPIEDRVDGQAETIAAPFVARPKMIEIANRDEIFGKPVRELESLLMDELTDEW